MKLIKILLSFLLIALIVLIVTNPSEENFHRFITQQEQVFESNEIRSARTEYYLVCSTFEFTKSYDKKPGRGYEKGIKTGRYLGIFKNFYELYDY